MGFGGAVLTPARNLIMKNGDIPSQGEDGSCGVSIAGGRAGFPGARGPQGRAGSRGGGAGRTRGTCSSVSGGHEGARSPHVADRPLLPRWRPGQPGELPDWSSPPLVGRGPGERTEEGPRGPRSRGALRAPGPKQMPPHACPLPPPLPALRSIPSLHPRAQAQPRSLALSSLGSPFPSFSV